MRHRLEDVCLAFLAFSIGASLIAFTLTFIYGLATGKLQAQPQHVSVEVKP